MRPAFFRSSLLRRLAIVCLCVAPAWAAEFSVTPIRADLGAGALSETITVTNDSSSRLRVNVRLMEWTQDATGQDVYKESSDLVYFPRQLEFEGGAKRLVRVGTRTAGGATERTYRLFIEEEPPAAAPGSPAAVTFYFRFGVPVFVAPAAPRPVPEVGEPTLTAGRLALEVRNAGNQHFRLNKLTVSDGATFSREIAGWYSLAGTRRTYTFTLPPEACRQARALTIKAEGETVNFERRLEVDPARCG